jgi:hypothetical protein
VEREGRMTIDFGGTTSGHLPGYHLSSFSLLQRKETITSNVSGAILWYNTKSYFGQTSSYCSVPVLRHPQISYDDASTTPTSTMHPYTLPLSSPGQTNLMRTFFMTAALPTASPEESTSHQDPSPALIRRLGYAIPTPFMDVGF